MTRFAIALFVLTAASGGATAAVYDFPFKGEDLSANARVFLGQKQHPGTRVSVQFFGHDLNVMRKVGKGWRRACNDDESANENFYVYDKPAYAMRNGTVCRLLAHGAGE